MGLHFFSLGQRSMVQFHFFFAVVDTSCSDTEREIAQDRESIYSPVYTPSWKLRIDDSSHTETLLC